MRTRCVLGAMTFVVGLCGCMIVESPIRGVVGTEVIWGDVAVGTPSSPTAGTMKEGKACAESILGLIARGDAGVRAAKANGGISEVTNIEHSARNFFGIVGEWCTLVRGY
jgi:TRL-like protein family